MKNWKKKKKPDFFDFWVVKIADKFAIVSWVLFEQQSILFCLSHFKR